MSKYSPEQLFEVVANWAVIAAYDRLSAAMVEGGAVDEARLRAVESEALIDAMTVAKDAGVDTHVYRAEVAESLNFARELFEQLRARRESGR